MTELLPIADGPELRRHARRLARRHRAALAGVVALHALAAAAGLVGPALLGRLVQAVTDGTTRAYVDRIALVLAAFIVLQTVLTWFARRTSFVVSERIFAELREDFMRTVLALPLSSVERAGTGDLVSRTTADVDALARTVRFAIPETLIAAVTTVLTVAAAVWVSPAAALALIAGVPRDRDRHPLVSPPGAAGLPPGARRLRVDGRHRRGDRRRRAHRRCARARGAPRPAGRRGPRGGLRAERYTLRLRTFWFPTAEIAYVLPVVAGVLWGGWLVHAGHASIGEVTAVILYAQQLADPVDRLISWLDEIQVGGASLARLVGIEAVPPDRFASGRVPAGDALAARDVRYAYVPGRDVLHGIDLDLEPGERVAVVGPSGAGKSTLGRLLAGIHPPRTGRVEVGGVELVELPLETLRQEVALVTQEQHVFVGHAGGQPPPRPTAGERGGARGSARGGRRARVGRGAARRARDRRRRRRRAAQPAPDPAARARPARPRRPAHARPRRGDLAPRPARGAPPRALARLGPHRPHRGGDRPPAPHRPRRRPGRRRRGRPPPRARHPRRAHRARRGLRRPLGVLAVLRLGSGGRGRALAGERERGALAEPAAGERQRAAEHPRRLGEEQRASEERLGATLVDPCGAGDLRRAPAREPGDRRLGRLRVERPRPTSFASARALPPTASAASGRGGESGESALRTISRAAASSFFDGGSPLRTSRARRSEPRSAEPTQRAPLRRLPDDDLGRAAADVDHPDRDREAPRRGRRRRRRRAGPRRRP